MIPLAHSADQLFHVASLEADRDQVVVGSPLSGQATMSFVQLDILLLQLAEQVPRPKG